MSLSKEEINKIKKQALINRRVQEIEAIANLEVELSSLSKKTLSGQIGLDQALATGRDKIKQITDFIKVIDQELEKYE